MDMADMVRVEWKVVVIPTEVIRCMIDAHPTPTEVVTWVDLDRCVDPIPMLGKSLYISHEGFKRSSLNSISGAIPMLEMEVTPTPDIHKPPTPPTPEQPTAQGMEPPPRPLRICILEGPPDPWVAPVVKEGPRCRGLMDLHPLAEVDLHLPPVRRAATRVAVLRLPPWEGTVKCTEPAACELLD